MGTQPGFRASSAPGLSLDEGAVGVPTLALAWCIWLVLSTSAAACFFSHLWFFST